jgi:carbonic anhydrase
VALYYCSQHGTGQSSGAHGSPQQADSAWAVVAQQASVGAAQQASLPMPTKANARPVESKIAATIAIDLFFMMKISV